MWILSFLGLTLLLSLSMSTETFYHLAWTRPVWHLANCVSIVTVAIKVARVA